MFWSAAADISLLENIATGSGGYLKGLKGLPGVNVGGRGPLNFVAEREI